MVTYKLNCGGTNCRGTALYLTGIIEKDEYIDSQTAWKYINNLEITKNPKKGDLMVFIRDEKDNIGNIVKNIRHMAKIVSVNPFLITHRCGYDDLLLLNDIYLEKSFKKEYKYNRVEYRSLDSRQI